MPDRLFPPLDGFEDEPGLTSKDAQRLAGAIESVANVVGRLSDRVDNLGKGPAPRSWLSQIDWISINCPGCHKSLFSASGVDLDRYDWGPIGKALAEHVAQHTIEQGMHGAYWQLQIQINLKQERR